MNKILDKPFWIKVIKECEELNSVQVGKNYKVVETNAENYITEEGISIHSDFCKKVIPLFAEKDLLDKKNNLGLLSNFDMNRRIHKTVEENTRHLKAYISTYIKRFDNPTREILNFILKNPEMFIITNDNSYSNLRLLVGKCNMHFSRSSFIGNALDIPCDPSLEVIKELAEEYIIEGISICLKEPMVMITKDWLDKLNYNIPSTLINAIINDYCEYSKEKGIETYDLFDMCRDIIKYKDFAWISIEAYRELKKFEVLQNEIDKMNILNEFFKENSEI